MSDRTFPILRGSGRDNDKPHPTSIPWSIADLAYSVYSARYGHGQSLEGLAQRGGFGAREMDEFVPDWRERSSEVTELRNRLAEAEKDAAKWRAVCTPWTDDDENGVSTWQGYTISHWTGEAIGPDGFEFDEGDIEAAKAACLERFKTHGVVCDSVTWCHNNRGANVA